MSVIFHLSIPINDFATARKFYGEVLGCPEGRAEVDRIDFDFYGHHMVAQLSPEEAAHKSMEIGKESYPVRHFGVFVSREEFQRLAKVLAEAGAKFVIPPETRHSGTVKEQYTMFVLDPFGNGLEFKSLFEPGNLFKKQRPA